MELPVAIYTIVWSSMGLIYLASPLGFSREFESYRRRITQHLIAQGHHVLDPWENPESKRIFGEALAMGALSASKAAFDSVISRIGTLNSDEMQRADALLAVLDGPEPDSGTVAEVGYGYGIGKRCFGLRTDFRDCGDLPGLPLNLQLLHFIRASGGIVYRNIEDICIYVEGRIN